MRMNPYLSFKGDCEDAFTYYEQHLGAELGPIFRYGGSPMAGDVPPDWSDKIMHGTVTIGGQVLMGGDVAPDRYEAPKGFSLSLQIEGPEEARRVYHALSDGGAVVMPLEPTFWAVLFGMVIDRFGIPWLLNCEASDQSRPVNPTDPTD
jgi:PhnB protein